MGSTLDKKVKTLSSSRQKKIKARSEQLIAEELTLRDLRRAHKLTQKALSEKLNMKQESISRLEHRSDILLSTLVKYIEAMGGQLKLTVEFPDRPPVVIRSIEEM